MDQIKLLVICFSRFIMKLFYIFPIKRNRIYLTSDRGKTMRCNPMYIYKYMHQNLPGRYQYIWEYEKNVKGAEKDTLFVKPKTIKSFYYILTSRIIISNSGLGAYIPKRSTQCFINTWHGGGAYKRVGVESTAEDQAVEKQITKICGRQTDIFVSSSRKFTAVMMQSKLIPKTHFLECGMPRNDRLVNDEYGSSVMKVKRKLGISADESIILFAPTYRGTEKGSYFDAEIDIEACLQAAGERFGGKWVFLMRNHLFVCKTGQADCINANDYPDMQELLIAADIFITDYSSTIWDYSLLAKPGFLFVPDLDHCKNTIGFYTEPETWAFPLAKTNDELVELIKVYDADKNREKIKKHHTLLGNSESGKATETIVRKIREMTD